MKRITIMATLWLILCASSVSHGHFVWVVQDGEKVQLHFSESAESSEPELLKNVATAKVRAVLTDNHGGSILVEVPVTLKDESLSGVIDPKASAVLVSHEYGVVSRGDATFLLKYVAKQHVSTLPGKWAAIDDAEHLPLEITPAWQLHKLALKVTFQGKPAAQMEVKASGCGIDETLTTDEAGMVSCEPKADGVLSVRTKQIDPVSGELNGEKYDSIRTYSTLTLPLTLPVIETVTHTLPSLPQGITSFGAAIAGSDVYVYGGHFGAAHHYSESGQSNEFRRISLTTPNAGWELLPGGPKLTGLAMVEYAGKLYRVGGFTAKNTDDQDQSLWSQNSFARFDPATGKWTDLTPLPEGRSSHDAAVLEGKLYVVGGWNMAGADSTTWHRTAWVCDLTQSELKWTALPEPPFQRRAVSLAACRNKLYVMGGMQEDGGPTTRVAAFDPSAQSWSAAPALLGSGMEGFGTSAFAIGDRLVVTTMSGSVQTLSNDGTQWTLAGQANEPRFFHRQLTTNDGRVLVVGGASMSTGKTNSVELMQFIGR
jgi:N-acetylneuraminic acid mutarotase